MYRGHRRFIEAHLKIDRRHRRCIDGSSRFASRFEEKKVCQTPFYRGSLEAVEARIDAPIEGIEGRQKKVSQAQLPSLNKLDKVVNLAERDCIFADVWEPTR
jgi:hypothetical protein